MKERFLNTHKHLKPVYLYDLYDRLLEASRGTLLLLHNSLRDTYELHSLKSFAIDGNSINAVVTEDMLTGWLVHDYLANNLNKFSQEVEADRQFNNEVLDNHDTDGLKLLSERALKTVETVLGREI